MTNCAGSGVGVGVGTGVGVGVGTGVGTGVDGGRDRLANRAGSRPAIQVRSVQGKTTPTKMPSSRPARIRNSGQPQPRRRSPYLIAWPTRGGVTDDPR